MRFSIVRTLVSLNLFAATFGSPAPDSKHQLNTVEDVLLETKGVPKNVGARAGATNSEAVSGSNTVFNDMEVPPMKELNGDDLEKDIGKGYWYNDVARTNLRLELANVGSAGSSNTILLIVITAKQ